jgi:predicted DNA-binding transcriptional regulator AlpA
MSATVYQFPTHRMRADREPWVDKRKVAEHLGRSVRWVEMRMSEGLPHVKDQHSRLVSFKLSQVDTWLQSRRAS